MAGGLGPKRKGNAYERELVKDAAARGVTAERTWGSNGETRGLPKEVDVIFFGSQYHWDGPIYLQAKRPKKIPAYLKVPPGRALSIKCKRSEAEFVALNFQDFLSLFKREPINLEIDVLKARVIGNVYRPGISEISGQVFREDNDRKGSVVVVPQPFFTILMMGVAIHSD